MKLWRWWSPLAIGNIQCYLYPLPSWLDLPRAPVVPKPLLQGPATHILENKVNKSVICVAEAPQLSEIEVIDLLQDIHFLRDVICTFLLHRQGFLPRTFLYTPTPGSCSRSWNFLMPLPTLQVKILSGLPRGLRSLPKDRRARRFSSSFPHHKRCNLIFLPSSSCTAKTPRTEPQLAQDYRLLKLRSPWIISDWISGSRKLGLVKVDEPIGPVLVRGTELSSVNSKV